MKTLAKSLLVALIAGPLFAANVEKRVADATQVLKNMTEAGDKGIPRDLLSKASCVIVVPNFVKAGFIVGGEYGAGVFSCRKADGVGWTAPGDLRIAGGKFGLLIGGADTQLVMLVMNPQGMQHLLSDKFQLGGEASAAAGPIGRDAAAMTDAEMHAEILTYSHQRGIYGGIDLTGAAVTQDEDANKALYGHDITNKEIMSGDVHTPADAEGFIHELDRVSSRKR